MPPAGGGKAGKGDPPPQVESGGVRLGLPSWHKRGSLSQGVPSRSAQARGTGPVRNTEVREIPARSACVDPALMDRLPAHGTGAQPVSDTFRARPTCRGAVSLSYTPHCGRFPGACTKCSPLLPPARTAPYIRHTQTQHRRRTWIASMPAQGTSPVASSHSMTPNE